SAPPRPVRRLPAYGRPSRRWCRRTSSSRGPSTKLLPAARVDISLIPDTSIPRAAAMAFQHVVDTYASETNKTASVWRCFTDADLEWKPHPRSGSVQDILKHQLLSERRFFSEFMGCTEVAAAEVLPAGQTIEAFINRLTGLASARLGWLASMREADWLTETNFFDVRRQRIWIFWRRVLHSAHHRTQLS